MAMIDWKKNLREGLVSGTLAGLFSAAVLLMTGKRETGSAAAAVNAESHWLWGRSRCARTVQQLLLRDRHERFLESVAREIR